ncbi:hypothetical protein C4588_06860 [Candidatus Parcubacteria bacterium]|nr:MAG: hypothetical protein C4588_06860 [Candidatus Parcubacteria bacterium]
MTSEIQISPELQLLAQAGVGKLADIQITKDDIVTIAVAQREEQLNTRRTEIEEELERLAESIKSKDRALCAHVQGLVDAIESDYDEALEALTNSGFKKVGVHLSHSWHRGCKAIDVHVVISSGKQRQNGEVSLTRKLSLDDATPVMVKDLEALENSVKLLEKELLKVRRELGQLSSLERQAKAKVAMQLLNATEMGRNLLSMLNKPGAKLLTVKQ